MAMAAACWRQWQVGNAGSGGSGGSGVVAVAVGAAWWLCSGNQSVIAGVRIFDTIGASLSYLLI